MTTDFLRIDEEKVFQIVGRMMHTSRSQDELESSAEMLEDLTRAAASHGKTSVVVQLDVPVKTKEMILLGQDWNESESRLNVSFSRPE